MSAKPGDHKTVQARILAYAREIGWTYVPRGEAEKRRGFDHSKATSENREPAVVASSLSYPWASNMKSVKEKQTVVIAVLRYYPKSSI